MGRKFSSGAFICSLNEMRMHYTWIAGDINFLPWTCSGPRGPRRAAGCEGGGRAREGVGWPSIRYITSTRYGCAGATDQHTPPVRPTSRWWKRWVGGRWRFHGLFRAHTSNHVRAFAGFSTYFREPGDFDEWSGEMSVSRKKKRTKNLAADRRRRRRKRKREISPKESRLQPRH